MIELLQRPVKHAGSMREKTLVVPELYHGGVQRACPGLGVGVPIVGHLSHHKINCRLSQPLYSDLFSDCFAPPIQEGNQEEQRESGVTYNRSERRNKFEDVPGSELIKAVVVNMPPLLF